MYQGAQRDKTNTYMGPTGDAIIRLCTGLKGLNYKLRLNNAFTTYNLLQELKIKKQILVMGKLRANIMKGADEQLLSLKELTRQGWGSSSVVTNFDNITVG